MVGVEVAGRAGWFKWDRSILIEQVKSVCVVDENGCWIWGRPTTEPYPRVQVDGRNQKVARLVLEAVTGKTDEVARHTCDVKLCCNPEHLIWGTTADNVRDRVERGRSATGDRSGHRKHPELYRGENHWTRRSPEKIRRGAANARYGMSQPSTAGDNNFARRHPERLARGEQHGNAVLTEQKVRSIRDRYAGGDSMVSLAMEFGVSKSTIKVVVSRKAWRHVA